jgi:hypothetical protein
MRVTYLRLHLPPPRSYFSGEQEPGWAPYDPDAKYAPASRQPRLIRRGNAPVPNSFIKAVLGGKVRLKPNQKQGFKKIVRNRVTAIVSKLRKDTGRIYNSRIYKRAVNSDGINTPELKQQILAANARQLPAKSWGEINRIGTPPRSSGGTKVLPLLGAIALGGTAGLILSKKDKDNG